MPRSRSRLPAALEKPIRAVLNRRSIGSNVQVGRNFRASRGALVTSPHGLRLGTHVSIGAGTHVEVDGFIGDYCLIARNVQIVGRRDHEMNEVGVPIATSTWVGDRSQRAGDTVHIGRDVWIGAGAIVLGGVTIGDCAVIGAGALVSKDIPPFSIAVGSPAEAVAVRFESELERTRHLEALEALIDR